MAIRAAIMAVDELAPQAGQNGTTLEVVWANAPSADSAVRAAERLIEVDGVRAIVGGLGEAQARVLSELAAASDVLFFNIGSSTPPKATSGCFPNTFSIEVSPETYIKATVDYFSSIGAERWAVVFHDDETGFALAGSTEQAIEDVGGVATAQLFPTPTTQPVYIPTISQIAEGQPDVVLVLLSPEHQGYFLSQSEGLMPIDTHISVLAHPTSQSRTAFSAIRDGAPTASLGARVTLWEPTYGENGAAQLNERYSTRWGEPMESAAWATYSAVKIFYEAVQAAGTTSLQDLLNTLRSPSFAVDVQKGRSVSFRASDNQLRQPLFVIQLIADRPWGHLLSTQLGIAKVVTVLPDSSNHSQQRLDHNLDELGSELEDCYKP